MRVVRRFALVLALLSANCGSFEQMAAMKQDTDRAPDDIERDLGTRPEVGFHIFSGELATVTVVIDSERVQQFRVSDLEIRVHWALASALKQKPKSVLVSLRATTLRTGQVGQGAISGVHRVAAYAPSVRAPNAEADDL
jgi:hypothetical protein